MKPPTRTPVTPDAISSRGVGHVRLLALAVYFFALVALAGPAWAGSVRLRVTVAGENGPPASRTEIVAQPIQTTVASDVVRVFVGASGENVTLPPGPWKLSASTAGFWSETRDVNVSDEIRRDVTIRVWPAGRLKLRLTSEEAAQETPHVRLIFRRAAGTAQKNLPEEGEGLCSSQGDAVVCETPRGSLDLRISAQGFAPIYRWSAAVAASQITDLGTVRLVPGGSLAGFVQAREGGAPSAARVRLLTPDGQVISKRTRAPEAAEAAEALPVEAVTDARGFFQITELPPGRYRVLARSSGNESGGADAEVQEGAETRLDRSLVLAGPASVEISVDPPLHPSGNEWGVVLQGLDASAEGPGDISRVPASGLLRMDGVAEGNYLVLIVSEDQRWLAEEAEVRAPSTRLEFRVRAISLRGHLKLGNTPLAAQLVFGGKQGATRVDLTSNEEGLFEGYLPRAGDWPVEVEAEKPPVHRFLRRVVVHEGASGQYELDLTLPDTHLAGEVVDSEFHPAPGAIVNVKSLSEEDRLLQTRVDPDGDFDVHGLPAGPALVSAVGPGEMGSDALTISIPQDGTASRVRLIVRPRKKLRGRIVMGDTGSPVAGAFAKVTPVGSVPAMSSRIATTDTEGRFETILPPGTREAEVTYGSSQSSIMIARVALVPDNESTLLVQPAGGFLEVNLGNTAESRYTTVTHAGATEYVSFLTTVSATPGEGSGATVDPGVTVVGPLAPGNYTACAGTAFAVSSGNRSACSSGTLTAGGLLRLRLAEPGH